MTSAAVLMMHDNKAYNAIMTFDLKGLYFLWLEIPSVCDLQCNKKNTMKDTKLMKIHSIERFYCVDHPNLNSTPTRPCDAIWKKGVKALEFELNYYHNIYKGIPKAAQRQPLNPKLSHTNV